MKFTILGDVHGDRARCNKVYQKAQKKSPGSEVIQIGDLGVGFCEYEKRGDQGLCIWVPTGKMDYKSFTDLPVLFKFFPGNHDNRKFCKAIPNCLGDYGIYKEKFFFVSGAVSIDKASRIPGLEWWDDEELTYGQLQECIDIWRNSTTKVILSHDGPQHVINKWFPKAKGTTNTRNALQVMIEERKPELVIFGHWHTAKDEVIDGVRYVCLDINKAIEIDI